MMNPANEEKEIIPVVYPEIKREEISVVWNHDDIAHSLNEMLEKYRGLIVTDENEKDMQKARREVVSIRTKLERFKKMVRAKFDAPKNEFSAKCDRLIKMVSDVEKPIADQLEYYEEQRKQELAERIHAEFFERCEKAGVKDEYRGLDFKSKWFNKTQKWLDTLDDIDIEVASCLTFQKAKQREEELKQLRLSYLKNYLDQKNKELGLVEPVKLEDNTAIKWESVDTSFAIHSLDVMLDSRKRYEASVIESVRASKIKEPEPEPVKYGELKKAPEPAPANTKKFVPCKLIVSIVANSENEKSMLDRIDKMVRMLPQGMVVEYEKN